MSLCCPPPAPEPFVYAANCAQKYTRVCEDGTGIIVECIPAGYLFIKATEELTFAAAQLQANAAALELARYRALNRVLTCNTISQNDTAACGLVSQRPGLECQILCDEDGDSLCDSGTPLTI